MDKKTLIQFLLLSVLILAGWGIIYYVKYGRLGLPAVLPQRPVPQQPAPQQQAPPAAPEQPPAPVPAVQAVEAPAAPQPEEQVKPVDLKLENKHLQMTWTNVGASLRSLVLLDPRYKAPYYEGDGRPPLTLLREFQPGMLSDTIEKVTFITHRDPQAPATHTDVPTADKPYKVVEHGPDRIVFERTVSDDRGDVLLIRKTVSVPPDSYNYDVKLEFQNVSATPYEAAFALRGAAGIEREALATRNLGTRVAIEKGPNDYKIVGRAAQKLNARDDTPNESSRIAWAAVANHYFAAILRPEDSEWVESVASELIVEDDVLQARGRWNTPYLSRIQDRRSLAADATVVINTVPLSLEPGGKTEEAYAFIATPKERSLLAAYGAGAEGLIEFGWFSALSRIAVGILKAIHVVLPNYGIAILILTGLVRLGLHPLTRKQQVSMIKMQKLQPQIAELQRKYADDKQAQTKEQMALFQKYGVHPLSGCGPMLLQLPVLIALYRALGAAIELRHAGFLWISDLSRPDTIFHLPMSLPLLQDEVNVLPILMAAVMFWQQKTMPTPGSEQAQQQQKMMKWMPLIFVVFFYHMSSGLVLYWTASSAIGIFERWLINRKAASIELKPVRQAKRRAGGAAGPGRGGRPAGTGRPAGAGRPAGTGLPAWREWLQKLLGEQTDPQGRKKK